MDEKKDLKFCLFIIRYRYRLDLLCDFGLKLKLNSNPFENSFENSVFRKRKGKEFFFSPFLSVSFGPKGLSPSTQLHSVQPSSAAQSACADAVLPSLNATPGPRTSVQSPSSSCPHLGNRHPPSSESSAIGLAFHT
jgi:hypothetical protein